jgi:hypothetical protein
MSDLQSLTTPHRLDESRFEITIPDGWQQGRGAFGGLILANLVRALEAFDDAPERALRSLTAELCGAVPVGTHVLRVERLRTGSGVSTLAARIEGAGEVLAHAVGVTARPRAADTDFSHHPAPTPMPPWRSVEPVLVQPPLGPVFASQFEYRVSGPPPGSGGEAVASGWIRPRHPGAARDAAYVTACADAWWPAILTRLASPRPLATLAFTLELVGSLAGLDPEAPLFHRGVSALSQGGYALETRELWGEDGRLVARNHQTIVVIK